MNVIGVEQARQEWQALSRQVALHGERQAETTVDKQSNLLSRASPSCEITAHAQHVVATGAWPSMLLTLYKASA